MKHFFILMPVSIVIWGCAATSTLETSVIDFKSESLAYAEFIDAEIAILPVLTLGERQKPLTTGSSQRRTTRQRTIRINESTRRKTGEEITKALANAHPSLKVVSPRECLSKINLAGISETYSNLLDTYSRTRILDQQALLALSSGLQSRYFLYSKIGAGGYTTRKSSTESNVLRVDIYCQLWDSKVADVIWEGTASVASITTLAGPSFWREGQFGELSTIEDMLADAATAVAHKIGRSSSEVPPPENIEQARERQEGKVGLKWTLVEIYALLVILFVLL